MVQTQLDRASVVKLKLLTQLNIKVTNDWLVGCVNHFLQQNPRIPNEMLYQEAVDQWKLTDLREIGLACLPNTVVDKKEMFILDGRFPLQLQYLIDISEPCYEQLRNLYNKKLDEAEDETQRRQPVNVKKKRMLKLELTDGTRTVIAMEHAPIPCLNTKIIPGSKILVKGPIKVINKVLFLEPKNVEILGGEVEVLLIANAFENVLLRALGQPLNPNPKTEYDEVVVQEQVKRTNPVITQVPMVFPSPAKPNTETIENTDDDDMFLDIDLENIEQQTKKEPAPVPKNLLMMDEDEDFEMMNAIQSEIKTETKKPAPVLNIDEDDYDLMNEIENEMIREQQKSVKTTSERDDIQILNAIRCEVRKTIPTPKKTTTITSFFKVEKEATPSKVIKIGENMPSTSKNFDSKCNISCLFDDSVDFPIEEDVQASISDPGYEFKIDGCSLVTIDQLYSIPDSNKNEKSFIVFCEIDTIVEKLQNSRLEWTLGVFLSDKSQRLLHVMLKSDIISQLIGYTAAEINDMKKLKTSNPKIVDKIIEILSDFKDKLQDMKSFMKIHYSVGQEHPLLVELVEKSPKNVATLKIKLQKEKLKQHLFNISS